MKIALFSEVYLNQTYGAATHVALLAQGLIQLGHEVLIVTSNPNCGTCSLEHNVLCCPAKPSNSFFGQKAEKAKFRQLFQLIDDFNPDLIHLHTFSELASAGFQYAKENDLPLVTTIHYLQNPDKQTYPVKSLAKLYQSQYLKLLKKVLSSSDIVLSASMKMQEYLKSFGIDCNVKSIPYCVNTNLFCAKTFFESDRKKYRNKLNLAENQTGIIFVGNNETENGLNELINWWSSEVFLKDNLHLVLIVNDSHELSQKINLMGLNNQITITENIPHEEINICYSLCSAFISASTSKEMKASPLEAIACGIPVILNKESANADIVIDGVNGFLYDSPKQMTEFIKKLSELDSDGKRILNKLVSRTAFNLTTENQAKAIAEIYQSAINSHYKQ